MNNRPCRPTYTSLFGNRYVGVIYQWIPRLIFIAYLTSFYQVYEDAQTVWRSTRKLRIQLIFCQYCASSKIGTPIGLVPMFWANVSKQVLPRLYCTYAKAFKQPTLIPRGRGGWQWTSATNITHTATSSGSEVAAIPRPNAGGPNQPIMAIVVISLTVNRSYQSSWHATL